MRMNCWMLILLLAILGVASCGTELTSSSSAASCGTELNSSSAVASSIPSFIVTFDSQGGSAVSSQNVTQGGYATQPANPSRLGYTFGGWYKEAACSNSWSFNIGIVIYPDNAIYSNITIYAKWNPVIFTVNFENWLADTNANPQSKSVIYPAYTIDSLPTAPVRIGFTFDGWWTEPNRAGVLFIRNSLVTNNITVFAAWVSDYIVSYDAQGGSYTAPQYVHRSNLTTSPATPTRTSFLFSGWFKEAECTNSWDFLSNRVTGNMTLYAKWTGFSNAIVFDSQGGSAVATQIVNRGSTASIPEVPVYWAHAFQGWFTDLSFTNQWDFSVNVINSNIYLYAKWLNYTPGLVFPQFDSGDTVFSVAGGSATNGSVVIPAYWQGLKVTSIDPQAFGGSRGLTDIFIPEGIVSVGAQAFESCSSLNSITLPNTINTIGNYAFSSCISLTIMIIPDSVLNIENQIFYCCSNLTNVQLPNGITNIGYGAFYNCINLKKLILPSNVNTIGYLAFVNCSGLTDLVIPDNVKAIDYATFAGCSSLNNLILSTKLVSIGNSAFLGCRALTNLLLPNTLTSIGAQAFDGCTGLKDVALPVGITNIGHDAFLFCSGLTDLIIPERVASIEDQTFFGCSNLLSITLPMGITNIGHGAFYGCVSLTNATIKSISPPLAGSSIFDACGNLVSIYVPEGSLNAYLNSPNWATYSNQLITSNAYAVSFETYGGSLVDNKRVNPGMKLSMPIVPEKTGFAFVGWYKDTNCAIPWNFTNDTVNDNLILYANWQVSTPGLAFGLINGDPEYTVTKGTANTTGGIVIPGYWAGKKVSSIGQNAFVDCAGLTNLTIASGVTFIEDCAFYGCNGLTNLTMPNSVTSVGNYAFYGCSGLTNVIITATNPPLAGGSIFEACGNLVYIYIPEGSLNAYLNSPNWAIYSNQLITSNAYTVNFDTFGGSLVDNKRVNPGMKLSMPIVPEKTGFAFVGWYKDTNCTIPWNFTNDTVMNNQTLYANWQVSTPGLAFTLINGDTEYIVSKGTANTTGEVIIPDYWGGKRVTTIGFRTFEYCTGLTSLEIPNSLTTIKSYAFFCCSGLTSLEIPSGVTTIFFKAFYGCSGLTNITIKATNPPLADSSIFEACGNLVSILIPNGSLTAYLNSTNWATYSNLLLTSDAYRVSFETFGGSFVDSKRVNPGMKLSMPIAPEKPGFALVGWYKDTNFTIPCNFSNDTVTNNLTLYAKWQVSTLGLAFTLINGDSEYSVSKGTADTTGGVIIPDFWAGRKVTSIGNAAFIGCSGLTNLTMPSGVTSIGDNAFQDCVGLTTLAIPTGVTSIGYQTFIGCSGITNLTLPISITSIGVQAFDSCSGLTNLILPDGITNIGHDAFLYCSGLTNLIIPNGVSIIESQTFYGCNSLKTLTLPAGVTAIGDRAFAHCTGITNVTVDATNPPTAGISIFEDCGNLVSIIIPNGRLSAYLNSPNWATYTNLLLTSDAYRVSFETFGGSFVDSKRVNPGMKLSMPIAPEKPGFALVGWYKDTNCTIPWNFTSDTVTDNLNLFAKWQISTPGLAFTLINSDTEYSVSQGTADTTGGVIIPDYWAGKKVTSIGNSAFIGCSGLTNLTIPAGVTSIGIQAFYCCSGLTNLILPDGITNIGHDAFLCCSGLTNLTLPAGVTAIGDRAFYACIGLTALVIPNTVTSIGNAAFIYCSGLTNINIDADNPPTADITFFDFCSALISIRVPAASVGAYKTAPGWDAYSNLIVAQ